MAEQTPDEIRKSFQDLDYTQDKRRKIADAITDKAIENQDTEMLGLAMKALDGMDKQSLGKLKINEKSKENESRANEAEALSNYLVTLSDRRTARGKPEPTHSDVPGKKLPEDRRPAYDASIRDASAGNENTAEFTSRVENGSGN
jgi:hypothetical protein